MDRGQVWVPSTCVRDPGGKSAKNNDMIQTRVLQENGDYYIFRLARDKTGRMLALGIVISGIKFKVGYTLLIVRCYLYSFVDLYSSVILALFIYCYTSV